MNFTMRTKPGKVASKKPLFKSRFCFPVFFPLYNDRLTIRVWSHVSLGTDLLIGSIPEIVVDDYTTSISHLNSEGKLMKSTWVREPSVSVFIYIKKFNLYGAPADEKPVKILHGTDYLGRVLLGMNLMRNDNPDCCRVPLPSFGEPPTCEYYVWIDVYKL